MFGLFASEGDALEALEPSDALFDARAGFVEGACEEGWLVLFVGLVGNDGSDAARSRGVPIGARAMELDESMPVRPNPAWLKQRYWTDVAR